MVLGLGWVLAIKRLYSAKVTAAIVVTWPNMSLAIMLVNKFFQKSHPYAMLYVLVITVAWSVALVPTKMLLSPK